MPAFADMESIFSHTLPPTFFPNFVVPPAVPVPGILCRMAKAVYPHWKDRRTLAEGKSIIPQLNVSRCLSVALRSVSTGARGLVADFSRSFSCPSFHSTTSRTTETRTCVSDVEKRSR